MTNPLTAVIALLAFLIAFYTLVAKERKTPFIIQSLYTTCILILLVVLAWALIEIGLAWRACTLVAWESVQQVFIVVVASIAAYQVARIRNQHVYFRDDRVLRNLRLSRLIKGAWRRLFRAPRYEHNPLPVPDTVLADISKHLTKFGVPAEDIQRLQCTNQTFLREGVSVACTAHSIPQANEFLCDLATIFLEGGCLVQYASCARHPVEFISLLRSRLSKSKQWEEVVERIVTVDAFSRHFGFTDSILQMCDEKLDEWGVPSVKSSATYAGVHSAASAAFNKFKEKVASNKRPVTLVVYETPYSLVDLESREQYRVFVRHVVPSERMWGGMFTVFVETAINAEDLAVLESYVDIQVSLGMQ